jgi:DNA-binding PadR family transcriptional regulator
MSLELTPAEYVVLGMLRLGARTGYDVKRTVELSTRFFWTISHAQIYPALRRLERLRLIRGRSEPRGKRRRRVYELTAKGETALRDWLRSGEPLGSELRDLGALKLFFADALEPGEALELLRLMRGRSERQLERLAEIEPAARASSHAFPLITLRMGIALQEATIALYDRFEGEIAQVAARSHAGRSRQRSAPR